MKFEAPEMNIQKFEIADVITTSGGEWGSPSEDD